VNSELSALASKALEFVSPDSRIGLGTGHAAEAFVYALADRVRQGLRVRRVPTSDAVARLAQGLGIPLDNLEPAEPLAVTVDGADEVERGTLNSIKGWGGALVRERIVASASRQQVLLVTEEKVVDRLGSRGKLPVEVIPLAAPYCRRRMEMVNVPGGLRPALRGRKDNPYVTDNGNWILDCAVQALEDPKTLEEGLLAIPGVVDTGLFLGTATRVLLAEGGTVHELQRAAAPV
jgi:ribose 5-phosphate isomerase A